ncbi:hypothetical protein BC829DRAFT_381052 [Chytridium lagenaria]|nr:hypothetical protein BC829DRAFT_381052 [Chytridium lagenaria]
MPSKTSSSTSSSSSWLKSTSRLFSFLSGSSKNASSGSSDHHHGHHNDKNLSTISSSSSRPSTGSRSSLGGRSKSHPGHALNISSTSSNSASVGSAKKSKDMFSSNKTPSTPTSPNSASPPPPPSDTLNPYARSDFSKRSDSPSGSRMQNGGSSYLTPPHNPHHRPVSPAPERSGSTPAPAFHFHSLERMSPPHSRSASPAPSVSAESFRRRTPVGALIASYELSVLAAGGTGLSAASRLSLMSNDQFRILANDLDAEASRRDIPGIDTLGRSRAGSIAMVRTATSGSMSESMMNRDITLLRAKFGPNNPAAAEAVEAVVANANSLSTSASPSASSASPIATANLSSSPTGQTYLANGVPNVTAGATNLDRSASLSNVPTRLIPVGAGPAAATTMASSLPRSLSATNVSALSNSLANSPLGSSATLNNSPASAPLAGMASPAGSIHPDLSMVDEDPDRTIWRSRLGTLPDSQFGALRRDVKGEMDRRKALRRGIMVPASPAESDNESDDEAPAQPGNGDQDSGFAASVIAAVNKRTNAALPNTPPSSRPNSDEQEQDLLTFGNSGKTVKLRPARRAAGGIIVPGVSAAESAAAAEQERVATAAKEKEREKEKKREMRRAEKEMKETKERIAAWRSRIAKLTDEQMAEVTADSAPFLPPRSDLSPKRNEARKELSKLPSRELKMLWSIIHESMKKRKMVA